VGLGSDVILHYSVIPAVLIAPLGENHKNSIQVLRRLRKEMSRIFGKVRIGKGALIEREAIILGPATIGSNTYIGSGCILGFPARSELKKALKSGKLSFSTKFKKPVRIGSNVIIRPRCVIYSGVKIGSNVEIGHEAIIREETEVGSKSLVGSRVVIEGFSRLGENVSAQTGAYISMHSIIGNDVFLGPYCLLLNDKYMGKKLYRLKGPIIEDEASIGAGAIIMPKVKIGRKAVVGAGAVVTRNVKAETVVVGVPAKRIRKNE
jgi:acetyltransferase-like isoleucine patch superfamily enzyme